MFLFFEALQLNSIYVKHKLLNIFMSSFPEPVLKYIHYYISDTSIFERASIYLGQTNLENQFWRSEL